MWKTVPALVIALAATPASALQPLHEDPTVVKGFYIIGYADEIRKNCESIDARMFRAIGYLRSLHRYAKKQGYSDEQIEELTENKTEKERLRSRIRADLEKRGASPKTPEGYCTVGREEIAKGSAAGRLLKAD